MFEFFACAGICYQTSVPLSRQGQTTPEMERELKHKLLQQKTYSLVQRAVLFTVALSPCNNVTIILPC